jgi:thiol-disulfide isomerase/thioredoxin
MIKRNLIVIILFFIFSNYYTQVKFGIWRGVLLLNSEKQIELPFNFEITKELPGVQIAIFNAQEKINIDDVVLTNDSLNFKMPIFDTEFKTQLINDSTIKGQWINHTKKDNNSIEFTAHYGNKNRFNLQATNSNFFYNKKWEVTFSPNTTDSSKAVGLFNSFNGTENTAGTFLTETGDYRYLEGVESNHTLYLSCFDGSHAFLFIAKKNCETLNGDFYSGNTWHENWIAKHNDSFKLKDPESLTFLKNSNSKIEFSFHNSNDQKISLSDAKYKNKVVIIQIMGSWCPNCMDETAYLSKLYKQYHNKGLEIIGLAYERTSNNEKAKSNISRLSKRFDVGYEILITGLTGKDKAAESLPFLNNVMAFPTTIILDRKHQVKSIYTGFNGPATGKAYELYIHKTEELITNLLYNKY